jgi:hypothetical protein
MPQCIPTQHNNKGGEKKENKKPKEIHNNKKFHLAAKYIMFSASYVKLPAKLCNFRQDCNLCRDSGSLFIKYKSIYFIGWW